MNAHSKFALIVAALAIGSPAAAKPVSPSAQWNGTWTLDTAGSKFAAPVGKRSDTRTYKIEGNKVSLTSKGTDAAGKAEEISYTAAFDGKWYPMTGNPIGDSISLTLATPRQSRAKVRKAGKLTATATLTMAEDGKRLTMNRRIIGAKGSPTTDVLVFDRAQ